MELIEKEVVRKLSLIGLCVKSTKRLPRRKISMRVKRPTDRMMSNRIIRRERERERERGANASSTVMQNVEKYDSPAKTVDSRKSAVSHTEQSQYEVSVFVQYEENKPEMCIMR
ncbi:hypothetical protein MAR_008202 [Mya arenaria]|uniref:Uncharacterized protein n=1 Tax=Mya arenaria TaxID=6604 RepID=A0ABY7DXA7_MYAAR|nr:hypothetical protein MAR_008202 [Mya arenaria]